MGKPTVERCWVPTAGQRLFSPPSRENSVLAIRVWGGSSATLPQSGSFWFPRHTTRIRPDLVPGIHPRAGSMKRLGLGVFESRSVTSTLHSHDTRRGWAISSIAHLRYTNYFVTAFCSSV